MRRGAADRTPGREKPPYRQNQGQGTLPDGKPFAQRCCWSPSRPGMVPGWWFEPPVGSVGDSYDNALAETINGLFKAEVVRRHGPWRSMEAVELATLEWVDWFHHRRLLEPIGNMPPAEAEARYDAELEEPALAA